MNKYAKAIKEGLKSSGKPETHLFFTKEEQASYKALLHAVDNVLKYAKTPS